MARASLRNTTVHSQWATNIFGRCQLNTCHLCIWYLVVLNLCHRWTSKQPTKRAGHSERSVSTPCCPETYRLLLYRCNVSPPTEKESPGISWWDRNSTAQHTHTHTHTHTHKQSVPPLPSPSLGNVFIAVLINNSTPATGEESGDTRGRDKENKGEKGEREREGGSPWTCWAEYVRPQAKANPYMCICGFSVCFIVYICERACNRVHVRSFALLFWQGQSRANPHLAVWLCPLAQGVDPERGGSHSSAGSHHLDPPGPGPIYTTVMWHRQHAVLADGVTLQLCK